jgi:hypothetical protein
MDKGIELHGSLAVANECYARTRTENESLSRLLSPRGHPLNGLSLHLGYHRVEVGQRFFHGQ